jgi:hypothetical protein
MNRFVKELNDSFNQGILPKCLDFSIVNTDEIDLDMLKFNSFYRSYEFAASKFPPGYENIPGMDKVIESCIPKLTPSEELDIIEKEALEKSNIPSEK